MDPITGEVSYKPSKEDSIESLIPIGKKCFDVEKIEDVI